MAGCGGDGLSLPGSSHLTVFRARPRPRFACFHFSMAEDPIAGMGHICPSVLVSMGIGLFPNTPWLVLEPLTCRARRPCRNGAVHEFARWDVALVSGLPASPDGFTLGSGGRRTCTCPAGNAPLFGKPQGVVGNSLLFPWRWGHRGAGQRAGGHQPLCALLPVSMLWERTPGVCGGCPEWRAHGLARCCSGGGARARGGQRRCPERPRAVAGGSPPIVRGVLRGEVFWN